MDKVVVGLSCDGSGLRVLELDVAEVWSEALTLGLLGERVVDDVGVSHLSVLAEVGNQSLAVSFSRKPSNK